MNFLLNVHSFSHALRFPSLKKVDGVEGDKYLGKLHIKAVSISRLGFNLKTVVKIRCSYPLQIS